jgi:hypothetical protein
MRIVTFKAHLREPGCLLPKIIVGLIHAFECTQLLAFGDAKLKETWNKCSGIESQVRIPENQMAFQNNSNKVEKQSRGVINVNDALRTIMRFIS